MTTDWLKGTSPAFRLMIATSWLAPESWSENQETAIREAVRSGPDWEEFVRLVDRHRTPAITCAALNRSQEASLPEPVKRELQKRSDACRVEAVKQCLLLASVLKEFNRAGIPVMPLKGPLLSLDLYGDIGLRQSRDLDLAVALEDLFKAKACLEAIGWTLDASWFPLTPRQWASVLKHEHHLEFIHPPTGCPLELHWRDEWETPDVTHARWNRGLSSIWQGCAIQVMDPGDLTLYLCGHGGDHAWFRAKWLGDLARAHAAGRLDWNGALTEARKTHQEAVILVGLSLLNRVYGFPLPDSPQIPQLSDELIEVPLRELSDGAEQLAPNSRGWLQYRIRKSRYERNLRPKKSWSSTISRLLYGREDFRTLRLPDFLCWAYGPLHPVLWAWRRMRAG